MRRWARQQADALADAQAHSGQFAALYVRSQQSARVMVGGGERLRRTATELARRPQMSHRGQVSAPSKPRPCTTQNIWRRTVAERYSGTAASRSTARWWPSKPATRQPSRPRTPRRSIKSASNSRRPAHSFPLRTRLRRQHHYTIVPVTDAAPSSPRRATRGWQRNVVELSRQRPPLRRTHSPPATFRE